MAGGGAIRLLSISFNREVKIMTIDEQAKNNMTYLYIKTELNKLSQKYNLTDDEIKEIETELKVKLGITKELCWI